MARQARDGAGILLVGYDPGDLLMIGEAVAQCAGRHSVRAVPDGEQALRFLRRAAGFSDPSRPALILLDLSLPHRHGLDVLARLKADPVLLAIPVVVLSSSGASQDIQRSYRLHANAYIMKPADYDGLCDVIRQVAAFFLDLAELPP